MSRTNQYTVEKILAKRVKNGREEYKIKWLHFDDKKDQTWEPRTNLTKCSQMLQQFERQHAKPTNTAIRTEQKHAPKVFKKVTINEEPKSRKQHQAEMEEEGIYEDNENDNEDEEIYPVNTARRPTAVRSSNNLESSKAQNHGKKIIEQEQIEEEENQDQNANQVEENLNQLCSGDRGKCTVDGIIRDKDVKNSYHFKVRIGNQRKIMSKDILTEEDPYALLYFYEKHIEFVSDK